MEWHGPLLEFFVRWCLAPLATAAFIAAIWALYRLAMLLHAHEKESTFAHVGAVGMDSMVSVASAVKVKLTPKIAAFTADGKLTTEEWNELVSTAVDTVKNEGSKEFQKDVAKLFGANAETWLGSLAEAALGRLGIARPAAAGAPAAVVPASEVPTGEFITTKKPDGSVTVTKVPSTPR
jgi:hypothetical protein